MRGKGQLLPGDLFPFPIQEHVFIELGDPRSGSFNVVTISASTNHYSGFRWAKPDSARPKQSISVHLEVARTPEYITLWHEVEQIGWYRQTQPGHFLRHSHEQFDVDSLSDWFKQRGVNTEIADVHAEVQNLHAIIERAARGELATTEFDSKFMAIYPNAKPPRFGRSHASWIPTPRYAYILSLLVSLPLALVWVHRASNFIKRQARQKLDPSVPFDEKHGRLLM